MKAFFSAHVQRGSTVLASEAATIQRPKGRRGKTTLTSCKQGFCAHKEVLSRLLSGQLRRLHPQAGCPQEGGVCTHRRGWAARFVECGRGTLLSCKASPSALPRTPKVCGVYAFSETQSRAPQYFMDAGLAERVREIGVGRDCGREIGVGRDCGREEMLSTPLHRTVDKCESDSQLTPPLPKIQLSLAAHNLPGALGMGSHRQVTVPCSLSTFVKVTHIAAPQMQLC